MAGNKAFRTSVVRSAAVAILKSFQTRNVRWAIYGDLAWHLLCGMPVNFVLTMYYGLTITELHYWN